MSGLIRFLLTLYLFIGLACYTQAQNFVIKGTVTDLNSQEPVPFANVYFQGTTIGTTTDFDGNYHITVHQLPDSIVVSSMGYITRAKPLKNVAEQTINFGMERSSYNLGEVVVIAGENPADVLMRKVIAKKGEYDKGKLQSYNYESYNKVEIDLYDIDELRDRKVMRPFQFVFDNVDSTSDDEIFLPTFLSETLSDFYYRKDPKQQREEIKASRISGFENESLSQFMGSLYQEVDVYQNWVDLLGKDFASPIGENAFNYYKYYIVDSANIDGYWCYKVNFVPKTKGSFTFLGDMWIADSVFALKTITAQIGDHVNINFVDKAVVYQEFNPVGGDTWMITKDKIVVKFKVVEGTFGIIGRKTNTIRDIKVNDPNIDTNFVSREDIVLGDNIIVDDDSFWIEHRHEPLSNNEMGIYKMVDSLQNNKAFKTWADIVDMVITGYYEIGPIEIGPLGSLVSLNRVETVRFKFGFQTTEKVSEWFRFGGYGAYGIADKRFKYGGHAMVFLQKKPSWLYIGGSYFYDLDVSAETEEDFSSDNLLANLVRRQRVPLKLTMLRSWDAYLHKDWKIGLSTQVTFRNRFYTPEFDQFFINHVHNENNDTLLTSYTATEATFQLRFGFREKFIDGPFERVSLGSDFPTFIVRFTAGVKDVLGSDFEYYKINLLIGDEIPINPIGHMYYHINIGKIFGTLPIQLLEAHPGNETYFYNSYAFNLMNQYEFVSDMYASLMLIHHFDGFFFDKIPGIRKLKLRSLITARAVVGHMTQANQDANRRFEFKIPWKKPYVEFGFGIENIFKVIRVDFVWRGTYRNDAKELFTPNWGILLGLQVTL